MLLTISAAAGQALPDPADLGYLLHKHPGRVQSFELGVGTAHVAYPEVGGQRCTVALLLEVDPVAMVRGKEHAPGGRRRPKAGEGGAQYVDDRPYVAGSLLAVALGAVFRTAMGGRCDARPHLAATPLDLEVAVPVLPCRGGPEVAVRLFEPLGWAVRAEPLPLDPEFPQWGDSRYVRLRLTGRLRVADALSHLYVLLPVLEDAKHYLVAADEVDKLLRAAASWLPGHPEQGLITRRYLRHRRTLVGSAEERLERLALERLAQVDDTPVERLDDAVPADPDEPELPEVRPPSLARQRAEAVTAALAAEGVRTVLDLGCGEGALVRALADDARFTRIVGGDVSARALAVAARRLRLRETPQSRADEVRGERVQLVQTSLTYRDRRLEGFDGAVLMEVVEHVDPPRLPALETTVFGLARPRVVVVTTPNVEHNVRYPFLAAGELRHRDHRFEWTRAQFRAWAQDVADRQGYAVRHEGVGDGDPDVGPPTQLAVFTRADARMAAAARTAADAGPRAEVPA